MNFLVSLAKTFCTTICTTLQFFTTLKETRESSYKKVHPAKKRNILILSSALISEDRNCNVCGNSGKFFNSLCGLNDRQTHNTIQPRTSSDTKTDGGVRMMICWEEKGGGASFSCAPSPILH